ncbi:hypothetical protein Tco_1100219, partial [Tanacetum coccineum]
YLEACAAISITKDFKAHFCGTQTQWSHLDDEFVDLLYQCFLVGAENRKKVPGDVEVRAPTLDMPLAEKTGKKASNVDEFERLHKRNKGKGVWCDTRLEKVMTSYKESIKVVDDVSLDSPDCVGLDSPSSGIPFDSEAWEKAIGDPKKNFYGHKITKDPEILHGHGTSSDSTLVNN